MKNAELVRLIEDYYFVIPVDDENYRAINVPGIDGRISNFSNPDINLVRCDPDAPEISDGTIEDVISLYGDHNLEFGWLAGPFSPKGFAERLLQRGFREYELCLGMAHFDLAASWKMQSEIQVKGLPVEHEELFCRILAESFDEPLEMNRVMFRLIMEEKERIGLRNYEAYVADSREPVGVASSMRCPGTDVVLMLVGATREDFRGRGVYQALVARRLKDAHESGAEIAIVQALHNTSAPICARMGFEELCRHRVFSWSQDSGR